MHVFFELSDCFVSGAGKYVAWYNRKQNITYLQLLAGADRVWAEEDDGTVRFLKNRFEHIPLAQVDMKEFMMVKLRCQSI